MIKLHIVPFTEIQTKIYEHAGESYPITIRNPEPGDYLLIDGHRRLLRRLFIDWKLPRHRRHSWPVMLDKHGTIIFVPRYRPEFKIEDNPRFFVK